MTRLAILGGGRMGSALLNGLIQAGWASPDELAVVELDLDRRSVLAELGVAVSATMPQVADVVLAVKPGQVVELAAQASAAGTRRFLSIAAGISLAAIEAAVAPDAVVIRAMPNTPALVGAGAAGYSGGANATQTDLAWAAEILSAVGLAQEVEEELLAAVTGVSGSGPAYLFLIAEALMSAGESVGLSPEQARELTIATMLGAAKMLDETGTPPAELRAQVTSPNGTTAAALAVLEERDLRAIMAEAVTAARDRSIEMGKE